MTTPSPLVLEGTIRAVRTELRRLGCYSGKIDGKFESPAGLRALEAYAKQTSVELASLTYNDDFLNTLKTKQARVCPLLCAKGQRESEGRCVAIECPKGQVLGSDGACTAKPAPKLAATPPQKQKVRPATTGRGRCFNFGGRNFCE